MTTRINLKHLAPAVNEAGMVNFLGVPHLPQYHLPIAYVQRIDIIAVDEGTHPYDMLRRLYNAVAHTGWYFRQDYKTGEWWLNRIQLPRIYPKAKPNITRCSNVRGVDTRVCSNLKRLHRLAGFNGFPEFGWVQLRGMVSTGVRPRYVNNRWRWVNESNERVLDTQKGSTDANESNGSTDGSNSST